MTKKQQKDLSTELKSFYQEKKLSSFQIERLKGIVDATEDSMESLQKKEEPNVKTLFVVKTINWIPYLAAAMALFAGIWISNMTSLSGFESIRNEVVKNHLKRLPMDVDSPQIAQIAHGLDRLDFALLPPSQSQLGNMQVLGGRYCSIAGNIAAQIKLKSQSGSYGTLYVAAASPIKSKFEDDFSETLSSTYDGVKVKLWTENGLVYVLARD